MFITTVCVLSLISIFFPWSQFRRDFNLTPKPPAAPPFNRGLLGGSSRAVLLKSCKAVFYMQEIEDRYNMITVSVNKTKRFVLFARTRTHICSRFWLEELGKFEKRAPGSLIAKGHFDCTNLSPRKSWTLLPVHNNMQEKQVYIASGEHVQPQQNWDAIYSARTLVIVGFHCAKYA